MCSETHLAPFHYRDLWGAGERLISSLVRCATDNHPTTIASAIDAGFKCDVFKDNGLIVKTVCPQWSWV